MLKCALDFLDLQIRVVRMEGDRGSTKTDLVFGKDSLN